MSQWHKACCACRSFSKTFVSKNLLFSVVCMNSRSKRFTLKHLIPFFIQIIGIFFFKTDVSKNDLHVQHALWHWLIIASPMVNVSKFMAMFDYVLSCLMQAKVKKHWRTYFTIPLRKNWSRVMVELGIDLHLFMFITKFKIFIFLWDMTRKLATTLSSSWLFM